ncbi:hypothetical protein [Aquimarina algiphila]|uniref:hypothetical protein n=1 Tax=Aquimarina algiphila TaxID=2047982 RepID=UPI00232B1852|nr:hypothetical protein [Aquimarina algiphila]
MNERLHVLISEIREKCEKANCFEFEYHWEFWGVMWYPWFLEINGKPESFSLNDISYDDLEKLCEEGVIELVKEYSHDEKHKEEFDKKKYRLVKKIDVSLSQGIEELNIKSICFEPMCSECNNSVAKIEIVEPNLYPKGANEWSNEKLNQYKKIRNFDATYLLYSGPGGNNGEIGDAINLKRKLRIIDAFTKPYIASKIRDQFYDMAGYCDSCCEFYCSKHWSSSSFGYGKCPKGHGKSLDPHWSPDIE